MNKTPIILGGGLAGLIAACHFTQSVVYEAGSRAPQHRALLRFRGDSVSKLTGIPFRAVEVRKAVVYGSQQFHDECPIGIANQYAFKVTGQISGRSIVNLNKATRYIAPDDFYDQLVDKIGDRIRFNSVIASLPNESTPVISTIPLNIMLDICGLDKSQLDFDFSRQQITVHRLKVAVNCDVFQTIYFPEPDLRTYRASLTGDTFIVEMINRHPHGGKFDYSDPLDEVLDVARHFGLRPYMLDVGTGEVVDQKYGKIVDIPSEKRHAILYQLTTDHGVYSLGRFATWRNILLDDVAEDILEVDTLIKASSYRQHQLLSKKI